MGNFCGSAKDTVDAPKGALTKEGVIKIFPLLEKTLLGEGAFWDAKNNKLRFCDIEGKKMWSIDYTTSAQGELKCDVMATNKVGAYTLRSDGGYLIGHEWAFDLLNEEGTKFDQVAGYLDDNYEETSISHKQEGRLNDGRCDR
jgi:sugar lactone lactonase YvrE